MTSTLRPRAGGKSLLILTAVISEYLLDAPRKHGFALSATAAGTRGAAAVMQGTCPALTVGLAPAIQRRAADFESIAG